MIAVARITGIDKRQVKINKGQVSKINKGQVKYT